MVNYLHLNSGDYYMIKFTQSDYVDIDKYEDHIRYNGYITCDMERMSNIYYFNSTRSDSLAALARDVMKYHSGAIYHDLQREAIYRYLTRYENCPDHYFYKKNVQGISIDAKKVLEKLQQNGYAREFLSYYIESRSVSSKCSKVKTLMDECRTIAGYDRAGKPLTRIPYDVAL